MNSASRALKTARDLSGAGVAPGGGETLPREVQVRKRRAAPAEANCVATRTGYGTRSAGSRRVSEGSSQRWAQSKQL